MQMEFSALAVIKLKYHSSLKSIEDALHPVVTSTQPRLNSSYKNKQAHLPL